MKTSLRCRKVFAICRRQTKLWSWCRNQFLHSFFSRAQHLLCSMKQFCIQQTWFHAGGWVDECVQFVRVYGRGERFGGMRMKKHKVCERVSERLIKNVAVWVCACGWGAGSEWMSESARASAEADDEVSGQLGEHESEIVVDKYWQQNQAWQRAGCCSLRKLTCCMEGLEKACATSSVKRCVSKNGVHMAGIEMGTGLCHTELSFERSQLCATKKTKQWTRQPSCFLQHLLSVQKKTPPSTSLQTQLALVILKTKWLWASMSATSLKTAFQKLVSAPRVQISTLASWQHFQIQTLQETTPRKRHLSVFVFWAGFAPIFWTNFEPTFWIRFVSIFWTKFVSIFEFATSKL